MKINSTVAKIPFWVLYTISVFLVSFNWIKVVFFQKNFSAFKFTQPWDYYLFGFFEKYFGVSPQQYFIFALPVVLIFLYIVPRFFGKLMSLDKKSNIKGDSHVSFMIILMLLPTTIGLQRFFDTGWRGQLTPGIVLMVVFSIVSWFDEKRQK